MASETKNTMPQVIRLTIQDETGNILGMAHAEYRTFQTGSLGYYATGKIPCGGQMLQLGCNLTVIGSKPKKAE